VLEGTVERAAEHLVLALEGCIEGEVKSHPTLPCVSVGVGVVVGGGQGMRCAVQ